MDLSYYPVNFISSSNELSANASTLRINDNPRTKFYVISNHPTNSTCDPSSRQLNEESSSCQLVNEHPYSGMFLKKGTNTTRFSRPLLSDTVHPIKSSLAPRNSSSLSISPICEWQIVLHLICYLTRLTPQLIPSTIIHAVAAPCLEVRRFLVTASNESCYRGGGRGDATVGVSAVAVVSRRTSRNRPNRIGESREGKVKINDFDEPELDTTIRGCLLILTELVILASERLITRTNPSFVNHSNIKLSCSNYYYYYYYHYYDCQHFDRSNNSNHLINSGIKEKSILLFPLVGQIIIQALMTTFVCNNTMHTYHSSRIHEAVILSLITVLNRSDCAELLPNNLISKFFVAFTSPSYSLSGTKFGFDIYPSFPICAKNCLVLLLRSWPGIFYFIHDGLPTLQTLFYTLAIGNTETRNQILNLLYGLFPTIPLPHPSVKELEPTILGLIEALSTGAPSLLPVLNLSNLSPGKANCSVYDVSSYLQSSSRRLFSILPVRRISSSSPSTSSAWDIEGGFIAAEGCRMLTKYSCVGFDLMNNYYALLLATLVQAGLYEALIRAVSDSSQVTSTRAGYLLGSLAYKVENLLPQEHPACRRLHHAGLLHPSTPGSQLAVLWLERIHRVMHSHKTRLHDPSSLIYVPLHSPFLECLAKQSLDNATHTHCASSSLLQDQMELTDALLDQLIASSNVLSFKSKSQHGRISQCQMTTCDVKSSEVWNWDVLLSLGRQLAVTRSTFSWESKSRIKFLKSVMEFLTPDQTCTTEQKDITIDKYTSSMSPVVCSSSIPNKSVLPDGLLSVDGLMTAINNLNASNLHDSDHLLVYSREENKSSNDIVNDNTTTNYNNNSNTSQRNYLINSNANFNLAWLSYNWPHASAAGIFASGLISHLAYYPPASEPSQYLDRFLTVLHLCLEFVLNKSYNESFIKHGDNDNNNSNNIENNNKSISQDNSNNTNIMLTFNSNYLTKSCGSLILFAASQLTNSEAGELRLEKNHLCLDFQSILMFPSQLITKCNNSLNSINNDNQDCFLNHSKIILSSLDYTHSSRLSRLFLTTAANSRIKPLRIYTLRLIRLLFRLKLPFLASWCIDIIVKLCMDSSIKIRRLALCLLDELCWDPVNVQALSQNILHGQINQNTNCTNNISYQKGILTPFAIYLLHPTVGPIGHRIFGRVLSVTTIFDKLCLNSDNTWKHSYSPFHSNRACCHAPQTYQNKSYTKSHLPHDELNNNNHNNNCEFMLNDPVNWMLDIAKKYYNLAYAKEMDTRFTSLFVTYGTKLSDVSYQPGHFLPFDLTTTGSELKSPLIFSSSAESHTNDNNDECDEEYSESNDRPSNSEFNFEDNCFFSEGTDLPGSYLPTQLINDQSTVNQIVDGQDSFYCLPLPKHLYACVAEHRNGIDLLNTRKDLEASIDNIRSLLPQILHPHNNNHKCEVDINDINSFINLKADMWALAHTCSTSYGQYWLSKHPELITLFQDLALHSNSMSIRAIAWICLNLISTSSNQNVQCHDLTEASENNNQQAVINDEIDCNESLSDCLFIPKIFYGRSVRTTDETSPDEMMTSSKMQSSNGQISQVKLKLNRLLSDQYSTCLPVSLGAENKNENHSTSGEQKPIKSSIRSQVSENFNRSRRWLYRHWSPSHRRFSPSISESGEHSLLHLPNHHPTSSIKHKHSLTLSTQTTLFNYDAPFMNVSSTKQPYSTWTHRDCFQRRQVVSPSFTPDRSLTHYVSGNCHHKFISEKPISDDPCRCDVDSSQSLFNHVNKIQIICLPIDLRILGYKMSTKKGSQKYTTNSSSAKLCQLFSSSMRMKHLYNPYCSLASSMNSQTSMKQYQLKSFIDIAADAQLVLSLCSNRNLSTLSSIPDEIPTDNMITTTYNTNNHVNELLLPHSCSDNHNQLYSSDIQITDHSNISSSHNESYTTEKSSLVSEDISNAVSSSENVLVTKHHEPTISNHPVEIRNVVNNWIVSSEEANDNHKAILVENNHQFQKISTVAMRISEEDICHSISAKGSPKSSTNCDVKKDDTERDYSSSNNGSKVNLMLHSSPSTCLSNSCSLKADKNNNDLQSDKPMTEQDLWCNQLLDCISNLSPNILSSSSSHDTTLDQIIHKAIITQQNSKGSIQLLNACTYTIIADLLGSYPFSRPVRTKIQSIFLYFQLEELMIDANNSLIEIEKYLASDSKSTE